MPKRKRTHTTSDSEGGKRTQEKGDDSDVEISDKATPQPEQTDLTPESPFVRSSSKYPNKFYTIGWVCALSVELGAAKGMLDETHGEPQTQPKSDPNLYTLGRIHDFSVVIACLPLDEYGTASAANLVGQMWNTFPNLKVGLFVGIGAAIPCFHEDPIRDIRLGDVVVGTRVVDYEMRKQYAGGVVKNTGQQDRPSRILRSSLQALKAAYPTKSSKITHYIKTMVQENQEIGHFAYKDTSTDQLCAPCLIGGDCDRGRNVTKSQRRSSRPDKEAQIHYGIIASGNTLCRDRDFREKIRKEFDAICFDMEAAGVMNNFEGLVVRGISDYADCHKNDDWHSYAAASAAGYTKLLLCYVPANVKYAHIENVTKNPRHGAEEIQILDWISQETLEPRHVDHLNRLQPGTGRWFLGSDEFKHFVGGHNPLLFCPGMPGAGKTMISTIAIDTLRRQFQQDASVAVCFLYFDYRMEYDNIAELVAIIIRQVAAQRAPLAKSARSLFERYTPRNSKPPLKDYISALQSLLLEWNKVLLVVDAIDECPSSNGTRQVFLDHLNTIQANSNVKIMITGRPDPDIIDVMHSGGARFLDIKARDEDVEIYITGRMRKSSGLSRLNENLQQEIKTEITRAVDGMFLLAQLYLDRLSHLRIPRAIRDALTKLPQGSDAYSEAFDQAMLRIENQVPEDEELAKKALAWITYATRPLQTKELQHALALGPTDTVFDETGMPELDHILSVCAGLVISDEASDTVRLVHYTTQEYFKHNLTQWFPEAKVATARTCLQYVSLEFFDRPRREYVTRVRQYHLYGYALRNLAYHLRGTAPQLGTELMRFLSHDGIINACASTLWPVRLRYSRLHVSPCHVAAALNIDDIIGELLNRGQDVNASDGKGYSPLARAAKFGSAKAVHRLLKEKHVNVNALIPARPRTGDETLADMLLLIRDTPSMSPLLMACKYGHEDVVATLLADSRVDLNAVDDGGHTALHHACRANRTGIVGLLVRTSSASHSDVVLDPVDHWGQTPFHRTTLHGNVDAMKILLETGKIDFHKSDSDGFTPLIRAAAGGDTEVVSLLLQHGANPAHANDDGETPLHRAVKNNNEDAVRLLLQQPKTDCLAFDKFGQSAIFKAAQGGLVSIVRMLLAHQQRDQEYYGTDEEKLLERVLNEELAKMVHLIRSGGIDPNAYVTDWATGQGHLEVAKALLDASARVNPPNPLLEYSFLDTAVTEGHIELVRLFLSRGVDPTLSKSSGYVLLHDAVAEGHYDIAELLLQETTAAEVPDKPTLLAYAAAGEDDRLLELLIKHKFDPNHVDYNGNTPLGSAAKDDSVRAVKRLLKKGASRDLVDDNVLDDAKRRGSTEILRLLRAG